MFIQRSQTNRKRRKLNQSACPNSGASSSSRPPYGEDYEGGEDSEEDYESGDEQGKGNDYEVFLSFRGKDTRTGFTDHLHAGLVNAGIHVFRDDDELPIGEEIGLQLPCCIKQSKISIPIISENYAFSKWCLRELVEMLKCKRSMGQRVFPIFYKVEPSQLRHLTGSFGDAINAHKENLDEMVVKEWEEALKEVSFMKGWESEKINNGHEASLIKTVVKKVMSELKRLFLQNIPQQLVGVDDHVEHIMSEIGTKLSGTRIIGLYGIGGVGKTTLAKVLYNKLSSHYECRSFVADIRESSNKGIWHVQKQLLSDILGDSCDVSNANVGINVIKSRFARKKVLIVLDDMDNKTQLNALVEDGSWIKAESIVIITTRDKRVLDEARAEYMYPLDGLPSDQSLTLFSRHAFRRDSTLSGYEAISRDIVSTTGGLPLALEVIGSFLYGKKGEVWKDTLKKLREVPDQQVQDKLIISYKALDYFEQQIFLDIACCFIGSCKQHLTYMWDACGFFPERSIEVLSLMSLIKIDEHDNLIMHDQLRDLGRTIVRLENPKEPQERSRLWSNEEVVDVLDNKKGTSKIEGLRLDAPYLQGLYLFGDKYSWGRSYTDKHVKELTNLRFLSMKRVDIIGDFQNSLPQLRWLQLEDCVLDFAVTSFRPKKLVVLDLSGSSVSEDWEGWGLLKVATELKVLNLSRCQFLRRTPDLSAFETLEILILEGCYWLEELHPSIGDIKTLVSLNVRSCTSLNSLPAGVGRMKELRELLVDLSSIEEFPISRGGFSLIELRLSYTNIQELPESIGFLKELKTLDASNCDELTCISSSIGCLASLSLLDLRDCGELAQLPDSIGSLRSLQVLILTGCALLREIPSSIGNLISLKELRVEFTSIEELPKSIGFLKKLEIVNASYCASLARLPSSMGSLESLSSLCLIKCHKLAQLPDSVGSLVSLQHLSLRGCRSLREIPTSIGKLTLLTQLDLSFTGIVELPESIGNMQNLRMLDISRTPAVKLLGDGGIVVELRESIDAGREDLEGVPSNAGKNKLYIDKHQKLSDLRSRLLALVLLKRPMTPLANSSAMGYQTADSEHVLKRSRPCGISDEINILPATYNSQSHSQSSYSSDDLPKNVVITLNQGSTVKSMDFHPVQQILLLVGTNMGDVVVWEVGSHARIALRKFKVWDLGTCSMALQVSLANDYTASVNRVMWSADGILFGVAYSKHIVHIYSYHGGDDIRKHLEIEAHVGSVNDLAFSYPNKQLCVVTCGEDRSIKVWDAVTGVKQQSFEGHEAPVYSLCLHHTENVQVIFSLARDGKIKAWRYDNMGSRIDYDAPGHSYNGMAYSADGTRLFLCGTNEEGKPYLVEWNESEGSVKRTYCGLGKRPGGAAQFDATKNKFLAAGDEFMVKFWDMDNKNLLTSTDADGGLPASPCIRFNKEGILLAVSTSDNGLKILANANGIRLLRTVDNRPFDASRITPGPLMKPLATEAFGSGNATVGASLGDRGAPVAAMVVMNSKSMANVKPSIADESGDKTQIWKLTEINEPSQCRSLRLPDDLPATRVSRLIYTNSGLAILALSSDAVHKLWKWPKRDNKSKGRDMTSVVPELWKPPSRNWMMTNDTSDTNPDDAVPCFALSKNDCYLISASGRKISLFNLLTFKTLTTFVPSPPPATFLVFYPQDNNIIAIGMEDSSVVIYNVRSDEVMKNLKGHRKRITGLAFSNILNVLVSSGADSQLCAWSTDRWEKQASKVLLMPTKQDATLLSGTHVQFHQDQIHLLVVHETWIAIYEAPKLDCLKQWVTGEASAPITHASYSCDGQSIYVSFEDGSVGVLIGSTLGFSCRITPAAYIPPNPSLRVYPLVVAAHPSEPNQFALGLTDGSVYVLEPLESEGQWGTLPPVENGDGPSTTSGATSSDQPHR